MTQLLKSRLRVVKSGLGLDRALLVEEGPMHRKGARDGQHPSLTVGGDAAKGKR